MQDTEKRRFAPQLESLIAIGIRTLLQKEGSDSPPSPKDAAKELLAEMRLNV